jgi:hypothetical protein
MEIQEGMAKEDSLVKLAQLDLQGQLVQQV